MRRGNVRHARAHEARDSSFGSCARRMNAPPVALQIGSWLELRGSGAEQTLEYQIERAAQNEMVIPPPPLPEPNRGFTTLLKMEPNV